MDQLLCASLSHTRYWYEVGMFKVPAVCATIGTRLNQSRKELSFCLSYQCSHLDVLQFPPLTWWMLLHEGLR